MAEENDTSQEAPIAPPDTLLGQLQRGRGSGFLWALREDPQTVQPLLLECMMHDPRCDHQIEERGDYYARLALLTGLALAPLRHYLETSDDDRLGWKTPFTIKTLGRLAKLGSLEAVAILRDYIGYGPQWDWALQQLVSLPGTEPTADLDTVLCGRFKTGEELEESSVYDLFAEDDMRIQWQKWRSSNLGIAKLLDEVEEIERSYAHRRRQAPDYNSYSVEQLLEAVDAQNYRQLVKILLSRLQRADKPRYISAFQKDNPYAWWVAFQCLDAMKIIEPLYQYLLARLTTYLEGLSGETTTARHPRRIVVLILVRLPGNLTLPFARRWYVSDQWHLRITGERILENHATEADIPLARSAITEALAESTPCTTAVYRLCGGLDIVARFPDIGILPEVERAFIEAVYSYARKRAASAMYTNAPTWFASNHAYECLWDCEDEIRQLGCEAVDLSVLGAAERLRELIHDPFETINVRQAARSRVPAIS